jgi:hypothetical protein
MLALPTIAPTVAFAGAGFPWYYDQSLQYEALRTKDGTGVLTLDGCVGCSIKPLSGSIGALPFSPNMPLVIAGLLAVAGGVGLALSMGSKPRRVRNRK